MQKYTGHSGGEESSVNIYNSRRSSVSYQSTTSPETRQLNTHMASFDTPWSIVSAGGPVQPYLGGTSWQNVSPVPDGPVLAELMDLSASTTPTWNFITMNDGTVKIANVSQKLGLTGIVALAKEAVSSM